MASKKTGISESIRHLSDREQDYLVEILRRLQDRKRISLELLYSIATFDHEDMTKASLAKYLGTTSQKINKWVDRGMPVNVNKNVNMQKFFAWYTNLMNENKSGEFEKEKIRKMSADAMLSEMKVAKEEGLLVMRDLMLRSIERNISTCSQMIKSIPNELGMLVPKKLRRDYLIEAEIKINDILNVLADTGEIEEVE